MIKLVACDLDGTLFNSNMEISKENKRAIIAAQKSGIEFLVATGRAPKESKFLLKDAHIQTGFINLNGALVFDENNNLIVTHPLPSQKTAKLIDYLNKNNFYFEVLTSEHVYSQDLSQRIVNVAHLMVNLNPGITFKEAVTASAANKSIMNITQIDSFDDFYQNHDEEIMKIIVFDSRGPAAFTETKEFINELGGFAISSSSINNIEINSEKAQKGIALLDYAKAKGINREEIAAIGDNLNDLSMIRDAGIGVAMKNAVSAIKKIANIETKSNNDNGVAYILNKFIEDNLRE